MVVNQCDKPLRNKEQEQEQNVDQGQGQEQEQGRGQEQEQGQEQGQTRTDEQGLEEDVNSSSGGEEEAEIELDRWGMGGIVILHSFGIR